MRRSHILPRAALGAGVLLLSGLMPSASFSAGGLDVERWLNRPGVKLLAVEFYATWCKPCMAAVPKWKALHDRYKKDGLRLVVVSTQDPGGGCSPLAWTPDDIVCDDDGKLAERFAAEKLPAAFLWSWQGNLLVKKGHVEDVEREIEAWMRDTPRIDVEARELADGSAISKADLISLVRAQIKNQDKLTVVASEEERKRLVELKKKSFESGFDERYQCEVGKDLSANSLLETFVTGRGKQLRFYLNLLSVERGCLVTSSVVDWFSEKASSSVAEGVSALMQKLRQETEMPWSGATNVHAEREVPQPAAPNKEQARGGADDSVFVPAGEFLFGCNEAVDAECDDDEKPSRRINVPGFRIDRTEVTVEAFARCVRAGKCSSQGLEMPFSNGKEQPRFAEWCNWAKPGRENHPINCVDWSQAVAFCRFQGKRLPSDAEWEKAARGMDGRKYPWGNEGYDSKKVANVADASLKQRFPEWSWISVAYDDGFAGSSPVGVFPLGASPYGALDMVGNVWEWTAELSKEGDSRSLRGGSWNVAHKIARASFTNWDDSKSRLISAGFRCAE